MSTISQFTTRRKFALERLKAATHRRQEKAREIAYLEWKGVLTDDEVETYRSQLRLLNRAMYSLYLDCIDAGADEEAKRLLEDLRHAAPSAARTVQQPAPGAFGKVFSIREL